jgi:hypothetical protein
MCIAQDQGSEMSSTMDSMKERGATCFIVESNACITGLVWVAEAQERTWKERTHFCFKERTQFYFKEEDLGYIRE